MITAAQMREARALITDPGKWCTDVFSVDRQGDEVSPLSHRAARFCAYGAIAKVMNISGEEAWYQVPHQYGSLARVNNRSGHEAILNLMDEIATDLEQAQ
jgi:hypothetical protein